jgi:hypothetical protein
MECKYCSKTFLDQVRLKRHQTTSKTCIALQNGEVEVKLLECNYCKKKLTSKHSLTYHTNVCKIKKQSEHTQHEKQKKRLEWELERNKKNMEEDVELKIQELTYTIRQQQEQHEYELKHQAELSKQQNELVKQQMDLLIQLQDELKRIKENQLVPHSTSTHNGNNTTAHQLENNVSQCQNTDSFNKNYNISITNYFTEERVTKAFESYNINTLLGSQKELANFTIDNFLLGENTPVYLCTDRSRKKFFFTDTDGKFIEDANCTTLVNYMMKHGISKIREVCLEALENVPAGVTEEAIHKKYDSLCAISKDGGEYQCQLGRRLPATVEDKKRLDGLREKTASAPTIPKEEVVTLTEEQENAIVEHEAYMMYTTIGGVPLFRLNKYRMNYRATGDMSLPSVLENKPTIVSQYHRFIQSSDMERVVF